MRHDAVTWLDFRADDLARARDFIRSLQEEGVIDELGFLALLGRFSDLLHPATTTLMRSARYFYFIAGIYRSLEREAAKRLEHFMRLLRADQIRGEYDPAKKSLRLLAPSSAGEQAWPAGMCAEIVPLLQRDQSVRADYRLVYGPGAAFEGIELEDVAAFAYVVVWNERHRDVELRFVVQFELNLGALGDDERDKAVNARLLEGVDARSLLLDVLAGLPGGTSRAAGGGQSGVWQAGDPLLRRATIEKILEACTADPSRIHEVEAVLAACGDASNMSTFREFWAVFRESLEEEGAGV